MKKLFLLVLLVINSIAYSQFTSIGTFYLPDGSGVNYTDTINVTGFSIGTQLSATTILDSLKVNIEHSFLGDLEMALTCPNGTTVTIFNAYAPGTIPGGFGGGPTYLGQALDLNLVAPGVGEEYIWSSTSNTFGDFSTEFGLSNYIVLTNPPSPSAGNSMNWNGIYEPEETFANLTTCPINGDWVITIRDNIGIDDGYVFGWGLYFNTLNPLLSVSTNFTNSTCGQCNGTATANVSNGTPPYSYSWNTTPIQTSQTATGLCPGTYAVSVTETSNGSTVFDTVSIIDSSPVLVIDSIVTINDNGSCNGSATAHITSPIAYTASWSPSSQTTNPAINLCNDQYCITVTDTNGCQATLCDTVNLVLPNVSLNSTNATCNDCNGTATAIFNNGNPPYNYIWGTTPTQVTQTAVGLCPGFHTIIVQDASGNSSLIDSVFITDTPLAVIDSIITTTDNGNCDGSATAYITSPITYNVSWSPSSQTTNPAINLCNGQYCITVTDTNGCVIDRCEMVDLSTGINELETIINTIYPNPVKNQVTISLVKSTSGIIKIKDTVGQLVLSKSFNEMKQIVIEMDIPSGVYFLEIEIEGKTSVKKLIKE